MGVSVKLVIGFVWRHSMKLFSSNINQSLWVSRDIDCSFALFGGEEIQTCLHISFTDQTPSYAHLVEFGICAYVDRTICMEFRDCSDILTDKLKFTKGKFILTKPYTLMGLWVTKLAWWCVRYVFIRGWAQAHTLIRCLQTPPIIFYSIAQTLTNTMVLLVLLTKIHLIYFNERFFWLLGIGDWKGV